MPCDGEGAALWKRMAVDWDAEDEKGIMLAQVGMGGKARIMGGILAGWGNAMGGLLGGKKEKSTSKDEDASGA